MTFHALREPPLAPSLRIPRGPRATRDRDGDLNLDFRFSSSESTCPHDERAGGGRGASLAWREVL